MKSKVVVLLSSGLDSSVNLAMSIREHEVVKVLTFDYGQRAASKEIRHSANLCRHYEVEHQVVSLKWLNEISNSSLTNQSKTVPQGDNVSLDDYQISLETAKSVWVPNRNGVFLNIAAAFAESLGAKYIVPGFNIEEAKTFPDNTQDFLDTLDECFKLSTSTGVKTKCFTTDLDKIQIATKGRELELPFEYIWPCYFAGEQICGQCESCQRFLRALKAAKIEYGGRPYDEAPVC